MMLRIRLRTALEWAGKLAWIVLLGVVRETEHRRRPIPPEPLALPPPPMPEYSQQALDELHAIRRDIVRLHRALALIEARLATLSRGSAADAPFVGGPARPAPPDRLSESQLAGRLDVTTRTLQSWRKSGTGPPYERVGRRVFYQQRAVDDWVASRLAGDGDVLREPKSEP